MIPDSRMPTYEDLLWPTLKALESTGGSASIQELSSRVAMDMALPDEVLDVLHKDGPPDRDRLSRRLGAYPSQNDRSDRQHGEGCVDHHRQRT